MALRNAGWRGAVLVRSIYGWTLREHGFGHPIIERATGTKNAPSGIGPARVAAYRWVAVDPAHRWVSVSGHDLERDPAARADWDADPSED